MLGPAYPVANSQEDLVFIAGKEGIAGAWRDRNYRPRESQELTPRAVTIYEVPFLPSIPLPSAAIPPIHVQTMFDLWEQRRSNGSCATRISRYSDTGEKAMLAGSLISSMLYGTPVHAFVYSCSPQLFGLS